MRYSKRYDDNNLDKITGKKRFHHPRWYYSIIAFEGFVLLFGTIASVYYMFMPEAELYELIMNRESYGTRKGRTARAMQAIVIQYFGKEGLIIFFVIMRILVLSMLMGTINEYRRYRQKCRMFSEGLIENFYDIYDDHRPTPLWRKLLKLFHKKEKTNKQKYPTKRILKNKIKEHDAFFQKNQK
jgi:hypothetical protein